MTIFYISIVYLTSITTEIHQTKLSIPYQYHNDLTFKREVIRKFDRVGN